LKNKSDLRKFFKVQFNPPLELGLKLIFQNPAGFHFKLINCEVSLVMCFEHPLSRYHISLLDADCSCKTDWVEGFGTRLSLGPAVLDVLFGTHLIFFPKFHDLLFVFLIIFDNFFSISYICTCQKILEIFMVFYFID